MAPAAGIRRGVGAPPVSEWEAYLLGGVISNAIRLGLPGQFDCSNRPFYACLLGEATIFFLWPVFWIVVLWKACHAP